MELVALEVTLLYAGRYVDTRLGTNGIGIAVGGLLGLVIWIAHLVKIMKTVEREEDPKS